MKKLVSISLLLLFSVLTGNSCSFTVNLHDTYGDGWNGNSITIYVNGTPVLTNITVASGSDANFSFSALTGDAIVVTYDNSGSWDYENEYTIYNPNGVLLFSSGHGNVNPTGGSFNADCDSSPCNFAVNMYDTYGDGWNGNSISVYVNGVVVLSGITIASGSSATYYFAAVHGSTITITYNNSGSWDYENEYTITNDIGGIVFQDGQGNVNPTGGSFVADCFATPPPPNEQDCLGAIPICGDSYYTEESYSGTGNVPNEINGGNSCLSSGELNDVWYIFTVQQDGNLMFTITPNVLSNDYDWSVYNLTNASCSEIYNDPSLEVSCNWSGTTGATGPTGGSAFSSQGAGGTPFNAAIPVQEGEVYVINISNWSSTQNGYFIDFSMSSGVVVDITPPELDTIVNTPTCGEDIITLWFTEVVEVASVSSDNFIVNGPGGPYAITSVTGTSGLDSDREYELVLDAPLIAGGSYSLVFSGQINDACGNSVIGNSLTFVVEGVSGSVLVDDAAVICYDDAVGILTASGSGGSGSYSYLWGTGQTTAQINNLPAGNYSLTVTDDVGVCYDIIIATVEAANAGTVDNTWAGADDEDWNNCANWGGGRVPDAAANVVIPGGCANYPELSENFNIQSLTGHCSSLRIQSGAEMMVDDDYNITINSGQLLVENNGKITITGNLIVNPGGSLSQTGGEIELEENLITNAGFICTGGEFGFSGNLTQIVSGTSEPVFYSMMISNSSGVMLNRDIEVNGNLKMNTGNLNLYEYNCNLGSTGVLMTEIETSRVVSHDGGGLPIPSTGTITASRLNPSGNVAGLGLEIVPTAALGNTTITRGHNNQMGSGTFTGNTSILRYYNVVAGAKAIVPSDLVFNYFDWELNGHTDGNLIMFQEVQYAWGGTPGPVYWQALGTDNDAFLNTAEASTTDNMLAYTKITLGSSSSPLPVEFLEVWADCYEEYVNVNWTTAAEINNDFFTIERSTNGINWLSVSNVQGAGNSNELVRYSFKDVKKKENSGTVYYRLKQTDFNGNNSLSPIVAASCFDKDGSFVNIFSSNQMILLEGLLDSDGNYTLAMFDICGKLVFTSDETFSKGVFQTSFPTNNFSEGVYLVKMYNSESVFTDKVIVR